MGFSMVSKFFAKFFCFSFFIMGIVGASDDVAAYRRMGSILREMDVQVFYINLEECKERRAWMESLSEKMSLPMMRIDACNTDDVVREHPEWVFLSWDGYYKELIKNMRVCACTMSHYKAIERGIESGASTVLILE